jgi:hypothetical protein
MNVGLSSWIVLFLSGVVAVLGLILAARGADFAVNAAGWILLVFGSLFAIRLGGQIAKGDTE